MCANTLSIYSASPRVGSPVQQANQPTAGLHTFDPRPAAVLQPPPTFSAVQAPPPQMQVYPPPTAQQVMARPLAGPPRSGPPSQGNRLLVDAVESGKITRDEAILLQNTLAEAKVLLVVKWLHQIIFSESCSCFVFLFLEEIVVEPKCDTKGFCDLNSEK